MTSFNYGEPFVFGGAPKRSRAFEAASDVTERVLHVRRLSLPDAFATRHHHVHEHHHHVWTHPAQPLHPYQPWQGRPPWQPWSQHLANQRCPTCGSGGAWGPMWQLENFPWGEKAGKFS